MKTSLTLARLERLDRDQGAGNDAGIVLSPFSFETHHVDFEDPDIVIDIETVGDRAGLSIWTRDQLSNFPFIHVD